MGVFSECREIQMVWWRDCRGNPARFWLFQFRSTQKNQWPAGFKWSVLVAWFHLLCWTPSMLLLRHFTSPLADWGHGEWAKHALWLRRHNTDDVRETLPTPLSAGFGPRSVLGSGSFQVCANSCVSISLTHLPAWSAVVLRDRWRWAVKQIANRNTITAPSIGGVHAAPAAGTDRTGLWDTEICSAWSQTCWMATDRLLLFAFSYFCLSVKWGVCAPAVGN